MALTDYISPMVIAAEGYIHATDNEALLANIDKQFLATQGWVNMAQVRNVWLSIHMAAQIVGISSPTLLSYAKAGYLKLDDGRVSLLEALTFDYVAAKKKELRKKQRPVNRR